MMSLDNDKDCYDFALIPPVAIPHFFPTFAPDLGIAW